LIRLVRERVTQVVLGPGPILRQLLARVNFQGTLVGGHCLGQKLDAFYPLGAIRLEREHGAQVVFGPGPLLRQLLARVHLQGTSIGDASGNQMFVASLSLHPNS
jgi:hypothetical protein